SRPLEQVAARQLPPHASAKPTHHCMPLYPAFCRDAYVALAKRAAEIGSYVWIDMEEPWYVDQTLALFRDVHAAGQRVGLAMQAYLYRTPKDVESLLPPNRRSAWSKARTTNRPKSPSRRRPTPTAPTSRSASSSSTAAGT